MKESLLKIWLLLLSRERFNFFLLMILMIINATMELLGVAIVPIYVKLITDPGSIVETEQILLIFPEIQSLTLKTLIMAGGIFVLIIYCIKTIITILLEYWQERFARGRQLRLSIALFSRYLSSPYSFYIQRNTSELIRNIQSEVEIFTKSVLAPLLKLIVQFFFVPVIFISLFIVAPLASLITILILIVAVGVYHQLIRKQLNRYGKVLQDERQEQLQAIQQGFGGIKEVIVNQRQEHFIQVFRESTKRMIKALIYSSMASRVNIPYLELIAVIGLILLSSLLVLFESSSDNVIPIITFFAMALFRLKQGFASISASFTAIRTNHFAINPIFKDLHNYKKSSKVSSNPFGFKKFLELKSISFTYPNVSEATLKDISLTIPKGCSIGITGSTGAGKTTLVDVILGLLNPQKGKVLVDGMEIERNISGWQQNISYIPQEIYLLDDTIRQNIAFGIPDSLIEKNKIMEVLEIAQLSDFIESLPQGLDTVVGERGVRMSGGQCQRIGIARALYKHPSVLVMDEATASLDNKTERLFVKSLETIGERYTLIIIAHRLSTIKYCDQIIVMDKGKITAKGSYEYLMESDSIFQELAR